MAEWSLCLTVASQAFEKDKSHILCDYGSGTNQRVYSHSWEGSHLCQLIFRGHNSVIGSWPTLRFILMRKSIKCTPKPLWCGLSHLLDSSPWARWPQPWLPVAIGGWSFQMMCLALGSHVGKHQTSLSLGIGTEQESFAFWKLPVHSLYASKMYHSKM